MSLPHTTPKSELTMMRGMLLVKMTRWEAFSKHSTREAFSKHSTTSTFAGSTAGTAAFSFALDASERTTGRTSTEFSSSFRTTIWPVFPLAPVTTTFIPAACVRPVCAVGVAWLSLKLCLASRVQIGKINLILKKGKSVPVFLGSFKSPEVSVTTSNGRRDHADGAGREGRLRQVRRKAPRPLPPRPTRTQEPPPSAKVGPRLEEGIALEESFGELRASSLQRERGPEGDREAEAA